MTTAAGALWSVEDLAHYLGVPVKTIYAWRYKRRGPQALRVGRHLRFRPADVERWLAQTAAEDPEAGGRVEQREEGAYGIR